MIKYLTMRLKDQIPWHCMKFYLGSGLTNLMGLILWSPHPLSLETCILEIGSDVWSVLNGHKWRQFIFKWSILARTVKHFMFSECKQKLWDKLRIHRHSFNKIALNALNSSVKCTLSVAHKLYKKLKVLFKNSGFCLAACRALIIGH